MSLIFDIKRFALNDGPGIRTTLFLKGCPLHCIWCHNPEGISTRAEKMYNRKKCIGCSTCVDQCPLHLLHLTPDGILQDEGCTRCGRCTLECPTKAMEMSGREWKTDELMAVVEKERKVMEDSGGGVTLCGGEPLMHPDYALQLLDELGRRRLHRAVDTTLYVSDQTLERVMPACELLLIDLKHMDSQQHQLYTGVPNERILQGIRHVSQRSHPFWIRIPMIAGINADDENLKASASFLASLPVKPEVVNLLPYHDIGKGKHERLGTTYNPQSVLMRTPTDEEQQHALSILQDAGLNARIGG